MDLTKQQQLAEFLNRTVLWSRAPIRYGGLPLLSAYDHLYVQPRPTAEEIARQWIELEEFRALKLGTWLNTPEGELVAQAVEMVLPPFYKQDAQLLVAALRLAADMQQRQQRFAGGLALGAVAVLAVLALTGGEGSGA